MEYSSIVLCSCLTYFLLIVAHIIEKNEPETNDFSTVFGGIEFAQMANNFQYYVVMFEP